jgi:hypothetical protein
MRFKEQYRDMYNKATQELNKLSAEERQKIEVRAKEMGEYIQSNILPIKLMLDANPNNLTTLLMFGQVTKDFCTKFECSMDELRSYLVIMNDKFQDQLLYDIGGSMRDDMVPKHYQRKNRQNRERMEREEKTPEPKGMTIGEMLKAKGINIKS